MGLQWGGGDGVEAEGPRKGKNDVHIKGVGLLLSWRVLVRSVEELLNAEEELKNDIQFDGEEKEE